MEWEEGRVGGSEVVERENGVLWRGVGEWGGVVTGVPLPECRTCAAADACHGEGCCPLQPLATPPAPPGLALSSPQRSLLPKKTGTKPMGAIGSSPRLLSSSNAVCSCLHDAAEGRRSRSLNQGQRRTLPQKNRNSQEDRCWPAGRPTRQRQRSLQREETKAPLLPVLSPLLTCASQSCREWQGATRAQGRSEKGGRRWSGLRIRRSRAEV